MDVAVVKLGVGNTASVMFALERLGARALLTEDPVQVRDAPRVILPGVGAAAAVMRLLSQNGMAEVLRKFSRPLLGICLGQQLLYDRSEEGDAEGLGLLPGAVTALGATAERPSPHMGWSALRITRDNPLTEGVRTGDYAYFVHSYVCPVDSTTVAETTYGVSFAASVACGAVFGCQFHPERSGAVGARILRNFVALPC